MTKDELKNIQKKLKLTNEATASALGIGSFTVCQWTRGVWDIPPIAEKALHNLKANGRAYDYGYGRGYADGFNVGRASKKKDKGYDKGYSDGFDQGVSTTFDDTMGTYEGK